MAFLFLFLLFTSFFLFFQIGERGEVVAEGVGVLPLHLRLFFSRRKREEKRDGEKEEEREEEKEGKTEEKRGEETEKATTFLLEIERLSEEGEAFVNGEEENVGERRALFRGDRLIVGDAVCFQVSVSSPFSSEDNNETVRL